MAQNHFLQGKIPFPWELQGHTSGTQVPNCNIRGMQLPLNNLLSQDESAQKFVLIAEVPY